jgi:hypothetical protein
MIQREVVASICKWLHPFILIKGDLPVDVLHAVSLDLMRSKCRSCFRKISSTLLPSPLLSTGLEYSTEFLNALPCCLETFLDPLSAPPTRLVRLSVFQLWARQSAHGGPGEHLQPVVVQYTPNSQE